MVGDRDGVCDDGVVAVLICSDSCCFFFLLDGAGDAELRDEDCDEDDVFALCEDVAGDDDCD